VDTSQLVADVQRLSASLGPLPEPVATPCFIVVSGLPGTGKSSFSRQLAARLPLVLVESDALRQTLFSPPSYHPQESARLFQACHRLIDQLLKRGVPLVLDSTNLAERHRERLYNIADRLKVKLILVRTEAPPEVVRQRLQARQDRADPADKSEADWTVYQQMKPSAEKIRRRHYVVDTSRDITPVVEKIIRQLSR